MFCKSGLSTGQKTVCHSGRCWEKALFPAPTRNPPLPTTSDQVAAQPRNRGDSDQNSHVLSCAQVCRTTCEKRNPAFSGREESSRLEKSRVSPAHRANCQSGSLNLPIQTEMTVTIFISNHFRWQAFFEICLSLRGRNTCGKSRPILVGRRFGFVNPN